MANNDGKDRKAAEKAAAEASRVDPAWPTGDHPVTELNSDRQGSLSPFGEIAFPLESEQLPYVHPSTEINRGS